MGHPADWLRMFKISNAVIFSDKSWKGFARTISRCFAVKVTNISRIYRNSALHICRKPHDGRPSRIERFSAALTALNGRAHYDLQNSSTSRQSTPLECRIYASTIVIVVCFCRIAKQPMTEMTNASMRGSTFKPSGRMRPANARADSRARSHSS